VVSEFGERDAGRIEVLSNKHNLKAVECVTLSHLKQVMVG